MGIKSAYPNSLATTSATLHSYCLNISVTRQDNTEGCARLREAVLTVQRCQSMRAVPTIMQKGYAAKLTEHVQDSRFMMCLIWNCLFTHVG
jgi:hypothetical protein